MILLPGDHVKIFPAAKTEWDSLQHVLELQTHFRNQIPQLVNEIESVYGSLNNKKVLDLGCGPGRLPEAFKEMSFYLGIDQSKLMIEHARIRFPKYHFVHARIEDYRNPNSFDAVTCIDILQHLENPPEELLRRILVLFDAKTFLFRTYFNAQKEAIRHKKSTGEASISHPISYFVKLVNTIKKRTDCTAKFAITKAAEKQRAGAIYIICERKPIR